MRERRVIVTLLAALLAGMFSVAPTTGEPLRAEFAIQCPYSFEHSWSLLPPNAPEMTLSSCWPSRIPRRDLTNRLSAKEAEAMVIQAFARKPPRSAGAETCGQFLERSGRDGLSDIPALQWTIGYLTGRTEMDHAVEGAWFGGTEGIALKLRRRCTENPDWLIGDAADGIFTDAVDAGPPR